MGGYGDVQLLRDDGLRLDGRKLDESRPVTIGQASFPPLMVPLWSPMA